MDVKLKVLGGAKSGLEIPLKKEIFTIGRSSECSLRAGSDAISRKHCAIRLHESQITIADLNSRNGTYVNGRRIEEETALSSGDEVRVGPLRFVVVAESLVEAPGRAPTPEVAQSDLSWESAESKDVTFDDSINQWLTVLPSESKAMHETTSLRLDDTQNGQVPAAAGNEGDATQDADIADTVEVPTPSDVQQGASAEGSEDDSFIRKRKDKKEPGKLPARPKGPTTKDSREAAAEVLRAMTRRR